MRRWIVAVAIAGASLLVSCSNTVDEIRKDSGTCITRTKDHMLGLTIFTTERKIDCDELDTEE